MSAPGVAFREINPEDSLMSRQNIVAIDLQRVLHHGYFSSGC